ncbi:hypothetical protein [Terrabacter sp. NPDC000476]|uniref:hypothetical protein n=1 Tax=Terrabacter sp. NPDC000476 TaxID=3154258 RepID=UPI00332AF1AA
MSSHTDALDDRDLANLAHVRDLFAHADPVPGELAERVKFEITVRALHAEVAELMDSALLTTRGAEAEAGVGQGVEPTPTDSVTFTAASVSLMVSAGPSEAADGDLVRVDGWVTTPGAQIEAVTSGGSSVVISDAHGRFVLDDLPHGPVHFVVTDPDDKDVRPVITPTIQI